MSKNSKAASAATAKPCPNVDRYREVETPHGKVIIRSLHASLTRDAAQAVSAFFENEAAGFKPALTIHPTWATETLLDDHKYSLEDTALVITGPNADLCNHAAEILSAAFHLDRPIDDEEAPEGDIDEDCEAVSEIVLSGGKMYDWVPGTFDQVPVAADKDEELDALVDAYNQLGATYSNYARALRSGDDEVADRLALTLTELEVRIERLEMPAFLSPETRAEEIFAIRDSKRNGRRR